MKDRSLAVAALLVVALAALAPALAAGVPANQVPVHEAEPGAALASPTGAGWDAVDPATVELASAPSSVPDAADTSAGQVTVQVATTDDRLYVRLAWADATADEAITGPLAFLDAAAVQFPANASAHPGIAMGSQGTPVNVWFWTPAGGEELFAGGPGTTTTADPTAVETTSTHDGDGWAVVFQRELVTDDDRRVAFTGDSDVDVAFAVWNGSNLERSGRKAVSEWHHLPLGPPPQGPPYEAILWAVAGLAVVVVVVVTAVAIRRAGP